MIGILCVRRISSACLKFNDLSEMADMPAWLSDDHHQT